MTIDELKNKVFGFIVSFFHTSVLFVMDLLRPFCVRHGARGWRVETLGSGFWLEWRAGGAGKVQVGLWALSCGPGTSLAGREDGVVEA